ncbi:hypothetical protein CKO31_17300 [Thiohalocapsa halophila]|uniref:O-antigen ligase-related domain-containing protein n=1 Tax=Thiohalocapsa halophila TaxID=69359 RepID=A0ABS1CKL4_9GAMM|nr:O-antigen ligase family protein [Thiohalocapsa halophila]MBK1632465.1 hypothetical protein [Thiohalocapsa halophila]
MTFGLLLAVMAFTPLFRAGATPLAALIGQMLAIGLLTLSLWWPQRIVIGPGQAAIALALLLLPALYLFPLPPDIATLLPGRDLYNRAASYLPQSPVELPAGAAIYPGAAGAAVLSLLLPVSVFLGVRALKPAQISVLLGLVIAIAALQALLGLLQYGTAQTGGTPFAVEGSHRWSAVGTYANRNHLAGLIEMALPLTLALLFYALSRLRADAGAPALLHQPAAAVGSRPGQSAMLYGGLALLLILGVVFTRSRTGITLTILGIVIAAALFSRQIGRKSALGPAGVILALAVAGGISIGLAPVLDRFSVSGLEDNARWQLFDQTLLGAGAFFPIGSGPGAFPAVFPPYQPLELGNAFINRAHNDYLEWFFDLGALGVVLPGLVLVLYVSQWRRVLTANSGARSTYLQIGSGIGVLLLSFHEFVDYNLYTPANQVVFALLLSVFLYPPDLLADTAKRRSRRKRRTPDLEPKARPEPASVQPPTDQIQNPFLTNAAAAPLTDPAASGATTQRAILSQELPGSHAADPAPRSTAGKDA